MTEGNYSLNDDEIRKIDGDIREAIEKPVEDWSESLFNDLALRAFDVQYRNRLCSVR